MKSPYSLAVCVMWLALPFTALDYWRVWDQLPPRLAIHFDINWRANGWASREGAFGLMVGMIFFLLATFTITIFFVRRVPSASYMPWLMLAFFYATIVLVCAVNHWVIRYNLGRATGDAHCIQGISPANSASSKIGPKNG